MAQHAVFSGANAVRSRRASSVRSRTVNSLDIPNAPLRSLVSAYRDAAAKHGDATEAGDHGRANEAGEQISRLYSEIRRRGLAAQEQLIDLLSDPSPGVRLWSGSHALEFRSEAGEAALLELIGAGGFLGFSAEMTLREWRAGRLRFP